MWVDELLSWRHRVVSRRTGSPALIVTTGSSPARPRPSWPSYARRRSGSVCSNRRTRSYAARRRICPGEPAGKMMFPLVRELAADGIPVTVTCRVLNLCLPAVLPMGRHAGHGRASSTKRGSRTPSSTHTATTRSSDTGSSRTRSASTITTCRTGSCGGSAEITSGGRCSGNRSDTRAPSPAPRRTTTWSGGSSPRTPRTRSVARGSHGTLDRRRKALLLRDQRPVLQPDRRLVASTRG